MGRKFTTNTQKRNSTCSLYLTVHFTLLGLEQQVLPSAKSLSQRHRYIAIGQEPFTETPLHSHAQGRLHLPPNAQCRLQLIRSDTSLRMCSVRLGRAPTGLAMADTRRRLSKRIRRGAAIDMLRPNNRRNHAASTAHPICRDGMCRVGFQLCSNKDPERQNDPDRRRHTRLHNMRQHCRNDPLGLRTRPKENPPLAGCLGVRVCVRERAGRVCVCVCLRVCWQPPQRAL